jgi:DNA-binding MarR family transcriptional regulator
MHRAGSANPRNVRTAGGLRARAKSSARPSTRKVRLPAPAPPADIDLGPLAHWLGFHLRLAQSSSFQSFARLTQEFDVRPGRFALLMLIGRNPGISQTALSKANGRDKSTLTPALADLSRRRLITRRRISEDRRSYELFLTPAGETMLAELTRRAMRHEEHLERIVGKADRARFMEILKRIITGVA